MKKRRAALAILSCALLTGGLVSCGGETEEPIYVKNEIVSISIKTAPTKTIYKVGETFDPTGVVIESNWKDGSKKIVTKYTYDNHNPLTLQDKVITFSYEGFTCTQEITVREVKITGIEIKEKPFKTEYKIGQTFDPKGLVVVAKYEDNSTLTLSDKDYTIKDATRALTEADKEMIVQYKTFTASIAITVVDQIDVTIDDLETVRVEAENLDFSKAILRNDFAQAGRSFVEEPTGGAASGGKSICGYELNSIFEVRFEVKENATILIKAVMADLGKNYSLAEALEFKVDDKVLVAEDKPFGTNGYWDWCEFSVGVIELAKGKYFKVVDADDWVNEKDYDILLKRLINEDADLILTDFCEARSFEDKPTKIEYYKNLNKNQLYHFDEICIGENGFEEWGPMLPTSTYKLECLKKADFKLLEKTFYVDMTYNAYSIIYIDTVKKYDLDIYRYYIGNSRTICKRRRHEKKL